jgi:glycerol uptake facilitator-like aquaporin
MKLEEKPSWTAALYKRTALKIFLFEFTGTIILTYGVVCSNIEACPTDFFIACSQFLAISWCGEFTNAHVNSAVSVGLWVAAPYHHILSYLLAEFSGGFVGSLLGKLAHYVAYTVTETTIEPIKSATFTDALGYGFREFAGAFMFVSLILLSITKSTTFMRRKLYVFVFIPMALFISREY